MEIPRDLADSEGVPDDLDSSALGPYTVPSTRRRRRAALVYVAAALTAALAALTELPAGLWIAAVALGGIAAYHLLSAWPLRVSDARALDTANREVEFPVGHASASVGFVGWRARPVWNVLVFSADDPPSQRGLVRVDGVDGHVIESYVEEIEEDEG